MNFRKLHHKIILLYILGHFIEIIFYKRKLLFSIISFFFLTQASLFAKEKLNSTYKTSTLTQKQHTLNTKSANRKLIILSIDGFPAYYLDHPEVMEKLPNLSNLFSKSMGGRIQTINPSVTYASHTSMITGQDPGIHGIEGNTPIDPFDQEDGAWLWYYDDIKVDSLIDIAKREKASIANVYWPVTVGAPIQWNIPQFWREKSKSDLKILRSLSTAKLHREMEKKIGQPVLETTKDDTKIRTGIEIFLKYKPDLSFIYSTDVDTYHHAKGPFSEQALEKLRLTDTYVGELIQKSKLYQRNDLALIIISDHGFTSANSICRPNKILYEMNHIKPKEKVWNYYIKSVGGFAFLVANKNPNSLEENDSNSQISKNPENKDFQEVLKQLNNSIQENCKGVRMISSGSEFDFYREKSFPDALAIFLSDESTHISTSWSSDFYTEVKNPIYTHGFPAYRKDMDTIGFFYANRSNHTAVDKFKSNKSKKTKLKFTSVKDVFQLSCNWMRWNCSSKLKAED